MENNLAAGHALEPGQLDLQNQTCQCHFLRKLDREIAEATTHLMRLAPLAGEEEHLKGEVDATRDSIVKGRIAENSLAVEKLVLLEPCKSVACSSYWAEGDANTEAIEYIWLSAKLTDAAGLPEGSQVVVAGLVLIQF